MNIMKLALPFSNVPDFDVKVKEELDRLVATDPNFSKLRFYIDTNGRVYPEIGKLYEELVEQAIINVELKSSLTSNVSLENPGVVEKNMMMEEGSWLGDIGKVSRAKEFPQIDREIPEEKIQCRKRYRIDVELGEGDLEGGSGDLEDDVDKASWTDSFPAAAMMCVIV